MGTVIKHDFWYGPAQTNRTLHIYLPNGYEASYDRYPVMYYFDGHNLFFDQDATYGKSWGLKDFLDQWDKHLIVVGMECSHEGNARLDEYCPYTGGHLLGHTIHGIGDQTFQWIIDEVKPWADGHLRTWSHREATGIAGSSMGGLMSLYGVMRHNDVFSKAACLSPGIRMWGANLTRELKGASLDADTRIYLSWGELEAGKVRQGADPATDSSEARAELSFVRKLEAKGADTYLYFQPQGRHCEADWERQNGRYLDYLWLDRRR